MQRRGLHRTLSKLPVQIDAIVMMIGYFFGRNTREGEHAAVSPARADHFICYSVLQTLRTESSRVNLIWSGAYTIFCQTTNFPKNKKFLPGHFGLGIEKPQEIRGVPCRCAPAMAVIEVNHKYDI